MKYPRIVSHEVETVPDAERHRIVIVYGTRAVCKVFCLSGTDEERYHNFPKALERQMRHAMADLEIA